MCTLHSCRQGKAQQPLTALFINSIQERRTHSNQWRATHIHVSASSNQHISLLCASEMRRFSFVFGRSTTVVATRTTADKHTHTHTCTQCTDGPLLFCSSSEDVSWPTGKSAETTAKLLYWGDIHDIWRASTCCVSGVPTGHSFSAWSLEITYRFWSNDYQTVCAVLLTSKTRWLQPIRDERSVVLFVCFKKI